MNDIKRASSTDGVEDQFFGNVEIAFLIAGCVSSAGLALLSEA
jgi:hypothetical protein